MSPYDDSLYNRITELVSLLNYPGTEMTIAGISKITRTSLEQTREDLTNLHNAGLSLSPSAIFEGGKISDARYDNIPISLSVDLPSNVSYVPALLYLSPLEHSLFTRQEISDVRIKDSVVAHSPDVLARVNKIEEAILEQKYVSFRYRSPIYANAVTVETAPRMLYFDAVDDIFYCLSFSGENEIIPFRLDRILFDVRILNMLSPAIDADDWRFKKIKYVWGASFSCNEEPCRVLIRIETNTANILRKIRSDIAGRPAATLTPLQCSSLNLQNMKSPIVPDISRDQNTTPCYYLYEDTVIGLNAFRSWLMSFGSSVKVLEPGFLAKEIEESSKQRLLNYEEGQRFHDY